MKTITNILTEMKIMQNWSNRTYNQYERVLKQYTQFQSASFEDLLREAEEDEEDSIASFLF